MDKIDLYMASVEGKMLYTVAFLYLSQINAPVASHEVAGHAHQRNPESVSKSHYYL